MTPLWFSICKPMNSLEVSKITGFCTDYCKDFLGEDPKTPIPLSIQLSQDIGRIGTINRIQVNTCTLLFYTRRNAPPAYIALFHAFVTFFAFHFSGKRLEKIGGPRLFVTELRHCMLATFI